MNSKVYKSCAVPQCGNTSINRPNKVFVYVPNDKTTRYKWLKLARRDPKAVKLKTCIYFCEDHFDLPNSMDNFMEYHVMGYVSQVRMKRGCIPTKFQCQADRRKQTFDITKRPYIKRKQKQALIEEAIKDQEEKITPKKHLELEEIIHKDMHSFDKKTQNINVYPANPSKEKDKIISHEDNINSFINVTDELFEVTETVINGTLIQNNDISDKQICDASNLDVLNLSAHVGDNQQKFKFKRKDSPNNGSVVFKFKCETCCKGFPDEECYNNHVKCHINVCVNITH